MPSFICPWALRQAHEHLRGAGRSNTPGLPDLAIGLLLGVLISVATEM